MRHRALALGLFTLLALAMIGGVGLAYNEDYGLAPWPGPRQPWNPYSGIPNVAGTGGCNSWSCHGSPFSSQGPHSGYAAGTDKCTACHTVHEAASASSLLAAATITGMCNTCHDLSFSATGGRGVYGAIRARGQVVAARHDVAGYNETEAAYTPTSAIPGGPTHLDREGVVATITCVSCHTPHNNTAVVAFRGDRYRLPVILPYVPRTGSRLLQDDPNFTPKGTYTRYGTLWCGACHTRRHSANPALYNHPTNNTASFGYGDVTQTGGPYATGMGSTNGSYIMSPTPAGADGRVVNRRAPLCQQCHEDYRNVEAAFSLTAFADPDGSVAGDNPRFQTFPHETLGANMTVETGDDLCMNCHPTSSLP